MKRRGNILQGESPFVEVDTMKKTVAKSIGIECEHCMSRQHKDSFYVFASAPEKAEELRVDRFGSLYWCDKGKVAWTKGVIDGKHSAISSDVILATRIT